MAGQLLIEYLERRKARFRKQVHRKAFTAMQAARYSDIGDHNFAKVVMVKLDGELVMIVLPAYQQLNLTLIRDVLGASEIRLATEKEFSYRFPRCEIGAIPPFGHLYGLQTYIIPIFDTDKEIAFSAGTHSELILMPFEEYIRLAFAVPMPAMNVLLSSNSSTASAGNAVFEFNRE